MELKGREASYVLIDSRFEPEGRGSSAELQECVLMEPEADRQHSGLKLIFLALVAVPVLAGSHAGSLFKLPHKMRSVFISAKEGKGIYGHIRGAQIITRQADTGSNHVLFVGGAEKLFVQMQKMGNADISFCGQSPGAVHLER